ncbi:hypothetical protein D3C71_1454750 [compost metagenome]
MAVHGGCRRGGAGTGVAGAARLRTFAQPQVQPAAQHHDGGNVEQRPEDLHRHAAVVAKVQRLRDQQRRQVPRQLGRSSDLRRARIHQHGLEQARGERLVATQKKRVVMWAGERRARERDERQLGARRLGLRHLQRLLQRPALCGGHDGLALIGLEQH